MTVGQLLGTTLSSPLDHGQRRMLLLARMSFPA